MQTQTREVDISEVLSIIKTFENRPDLLIEILHAVQQKYSFISNDAMHLIAEYLNVSKADVYGVVTFYHDFRTQPTRCRVLKICQAEACQSLGSARLKKVIEEYKSRDIGDGAPVAEDIFCLGLCANGPSIMYDGSLYARVTPEKLMSLLLNGSRFK